MEQLLEQIEYDMNISWSDVTSSELYKIQSEIKSKSHTIDKPLYGLDREESIIQLILNKRQDEIEVNKNKPEINNNTVICFDRDFTLDVGTPEGPISISYLQKIKENTFLTLATGNQMLKSEVNIPGKYEILQVEQEKSENAKEKILNNFSPDIYSNLEREKTIQRIKQIFPNKKIIVIDDYDLSHIKKIKYYEPFEYYLLNKNI